VAKPQGVRERIEAGSENTLPPVAHFRTGSVLADLVVGGGRGNLGFRGGRMARIIAVNSGGKSSLALEILATNIRNAAKGFWHVYFDREYRFSFDTESSHGVKIDARNANTEPPCPRTVEELSAALGTCLKENKGPGIVCIDSLEAFSSEETEDRAVERESLLSRGKDVELKGSYTAKMGAASLMSETLRVNLADAANSGTLVLALSQIRQNSDAGMYGPKVKKVGGAALDHWTSEEVWLAPKHYIDVGNKEDQTLRTIGYVVELRSEKSTHDRPYRSCLLTVLFGYGVDDIGSNIDYLFDLRDPKTGKFWNPGRTGCVANNVSPIPCNWAGTVKDLDTVGTWLTSVERIEDCRTDAKAEKRKFSLGWFDEWISRDQELHAAYVQEFPVYTRDQLIQAVEDSEDMKADLEARVIGKWEGVEAEAAQQITRRKRKF
jgi:RecA/RadA recombinase